MKCDKNCIYGHSYVFIIVIVDAVVAVVLGLRAIVVVNNGSWFGVIYTKLLIPPEQYRAIPQLYGT